MLTRIFAAIIVVTGALVMCGWAFDVPALTSILPGWVTMKFSTALCFALSGIALQAMVGIMQRKSGLMIVLASGCAFCILGLMMSLLASVLWGVRTGIEDLFVKEGAAAVKTTVAGRPSVGTMISFISIAAAAILTALRLKTLKRHLSWLGWLVTVLGAIATLGYILNMPLLYYAVKGWSTAMACHTAILFVLAGVGLILLGLPEKKA